MMNQCRLWRGVVLCGAVLTAAQPLLPGGPAALAQAPAARPAAERPVAPKYTKGATFRLPVRIDERLRAGLSEIALYMKAGSGPWTRVATAPPSQQEFVYHVPQDGEYWFTLVTIDRAGAATPRDVSREPPSLIVVVDTQPPTFELQLAEGPSGPTGLRCLIHDRNPDYQSLKINWRGPDGRWQPLALAPNLQGVVRIMRPEVLQGVVQVSVADRAGNQVVREVNLRESMAAARPTSMPGVAAAPELAAAGPPPQQIPPAPAAPGAAMTPGYPAGVVPAAAASPVPAHPVVPAAQQSPAPTAGLPTPAGPMPLPPSPTAVASQPSQSQRVSLPPAPDQAAGGAPRQLINTLRAAVEYRIDQVGPSGVGKVEVWMTPDRGETWQRLGEDGDLRSPAEIGLPGEGLYGIRLVVTNGNGFGGAVPAKGDAPTSWIEVDTSAPAAQLREIDPTTTGGTLELRWAVSDKNLDAEPIHLYYATRREGPWLPIARGVKNEGSYRWAFPRDAGGQFFVRMEVTDQAGNLTRCETPGPVVLDLTEPRALVVGITGIPSQR